MITRRTAGAALIRVTCLVAVVATVGGLALACSRQEAVKPAEPPGPPPDPTTMAVVSGRVAGAKPGTIVAIVPQQAGPPAAAVNAPVMDQVQMSFLPGLLVVEAGLPVSFHSSDSELHNVNVQRPGNRFPEFNRSVPPGVSFEHTFKDTGFYSVRCDIHPEMTAEIFVAATPFATSVDDDGAFRFEHVSPGRYTLTIYTGLTSADQMIDVVAGENRIAPARTGPADTPP